MLVVGSMPDGFSANCNLVSVATDAGAILEQMVGAASSDHSTIYRWIQKYAPEVEKRLRSHCRPARRQRASASTKLM